MLMTRLSILCSLLAPALIGCSKDKPAEEPAPEEKVAAEEPAARDKEADASAKEAPDAHEESDARAHKNPRDRLAPRRPPPKSKLEPGAEGKEPGAEVKEPGAEVKEPDPLAEPAPKPDVPGPEAPKPAHEAKPEPPMPEPVKPAAPETPPPHEPVVPATAGLDAEHLLPLAKLLEITEAKDLTAAGPLPGIATAPGYVSILYKGPHADKFGVSLQAWQDPARREADDRFRRMRLQYPNAEDVQAVSPAKAFFAHFGSVQMLTFVDSVKRVVATVACGEGVCTHEQLAKLARAVRERL